MIEHITEPTSVVGGDLFGFCQKISIPCGIAHTDLFKYCDIYGYDYKEFFERMQQQGIFWEMNMSFDSVHRYREHAYVKELFSSPEKLEIVKNSGVCISVGFDGHNHLEYNGFAVHNTLKMLKTRGLTTIDKHPELGKLLN